MIEQVPVQNLKPGDHVDLEGDPFADDGPEPEASFEFEYQVVEDVSVLVDGSGVCVEFDYATVFFPRDHEVAVDRGVIHAQARTS